MDAFATKAGRKIFERHIKQYEAKDPLYETYVDDKGRQRRRRRETPPGLSKRDVKVLRSVQRRAHYLDKGFSICGMRFGWTFVIGIIPGAGDAADAALNYLLVVRKAKQAEIPGWLLSKMLVNNAISIGVGVVPIVGDIVLAMFKANSRNAALLEEYLRLRGEEYLTPESERKQDAKVVKPGAGKLPDEVIPTGEDAHRPARGGRGLSWFPRGSKGSKKDKAKGVAEPTTATPTGSVRSPERGRFVEDVPPSTAGVSDVQRK
ncbi:hypothetical protein DICSQDRAFT_100518 [Dichomitus squalens LYAD-421 SS1]|uniref:uncharacterized protein n=1 Tax=Dichomitus squalens (strain LYAD-421) TaxID=732165 RepID=UPI0004415212|nr:uncharacterized protein DICSQDRAFT_100518 [Dichomitus squalens LYAD-421 SS1]EJF64979.1 hypothetical protein DICSQDRAFT_100518 [Dichomitus squalens LYAD-421 SS1]